VVEPERKRSKLIAKTLPARVVLARFAPAVAAPVAERPCDPVQLAARREHRPTLAGGHLMRGIEGQRGEVAERSDGLSADPRAERVAAVLHEEEAPLFAERGERGCVERKAHRVREHDRARSVGKRGAHGVDAHVVRPELDVNEDRYPPVLHDRVDGCREGRGRGDDLIAWPKGVLQLVRAERADRAEVRRGTRVNEERVLRACRHREVALKSGGLRASGEPEVERAPHERSDLRIVEDAAGVVHRRLPRLKPGARRALAPQLGHEPVDLRANRLLTHAGR